MIDLAHRRLSESLARRADVEFGIWQMPLLDVDHLLANPVTISDELLRIAGLAPGARSPCAADLIALLPPEARAEFTAAVFAAVHDRVPYSLIHRLRRAGGDERVVQVLGRCFFDEQTGVPLKIIGTVHDVTEQVREHEALLDSERRQRLLAEELEVERARLAAAQQVAKLGSWETDLVTFDVIWSRETHRIFATDPATFQPTHTSFLERIHPDDRAAVDAAFVASMTVREPCAIEHRVLVPGAGTTFVEERWQTIFDDDGRAVRALGTCQDISERKQADTELRTSRDLVRIANTAARLGGWRIELPEGTITISDELRALHDLPSTAAPTLDELVDLYDPPARAVLRGHMEACARDGTPYDVELPKRTATGRSIWLRSIGEAVKDASGRIIRLQGAGQDVTARRQAECELARMHRAMRVLSSCNEVLVRAQSEQELLDKVCRIAAEHGGYRAAWVGYANDDVGKTISVRAAAGDNADVLAGRRLSWSADVDGGTGSVGVCVRTGQLVVSEDIDVDGAFDQGRLQGRSVLCLPLSDAARTFGVLCFYSPDVSTAGTDEVKLLQELAGELAYGIVGLRAGAEKRVSEQKVREQAALLDQTSEAIFVSDLDDVITWWNRGAERLYGWTAAQVLGRRAADVFHSDESARAAHRRAQEQVLATGAWTEELRKADRSEQPRLIATRWTLLLDDDGQPRAVLTLDIDVTEKRQLEMQLLRTQRLDSIGTLTGGIAHDLNNVLTPILSSIAMLREDETNAEKLEDLAILESSAQRGASMVRQLLTFARGEPEGPRQHVDVVVIAGQVLTMIKETFPKDITPVLLKDAPRCGVLGNATQLNQLLTNLCVNARDAMQQGGTLTVSMQHIALDDVDAARLSADARPGSWLRLRVEDTGTGMQPEVRDRIFEPFFTTKAAGQGTGLGLSTCYAIVRNHGGFIVVSSEIGRGSCFDVHLPADVTPSAAVTPTLPPPLPRGHGELVLVVDDEEAIRTLLRRTLERFGYRVVIAHNGAEALARYAAAASDIAVVITDMSMPVMDGPTAVTGLQAINPAVRIIGSSGLDADGKAAKARALGVSHWVAKPYTAEALLQLLQTVIRD